MMQTSKISLSNFYRVSLTIITMLYITTLELTCLTTGSFYLLPFSLILPIRPPSSLATTNLFSIFSADSMGRGGGRKCHQL